MPMIPAALEKERERKIEFEADPGKISMKN
jgi:hypothetical protein